MKSKGILLAIWGNPAYGFMAFNFALSIRMRSPEIAITLLHDGPVIRKLQDSHLAVFTNIIQLESPVSDPGLFKASVYDRLPYDYTLYLDVDALCLLPIEPLLDRLITEFEISPDENYYRTFIHGWYDENSADDMPLMYWATRSVIWDAYGFSDHKFPATQSSIQFIAKCDKAKEFYSEFYDTMLNNPIPVEMLKHKWGGTQPDELYLNIAIAKMRINPDIGQVMWFCDNGKYRPHQLKGLDYTFLSYFGVRQRIKTYFIEYYDGEIKKYCGMKSIEGNPFLSDAIYPHKHAAKRQAPKKQVTEAMHSFLQKKAESEPVKFLNERPVHVITTYYETKSQARKNELLECISENLNNRFVTKVIVVAQIDLPINHPKLQVVPTDHRPTFNEVIEVANMHTDDNINILLNTDVYVTDTIATCFDLSLAGKVLCLSRWDRKRGGIVKHQPGDFTQDTWIWQGRLEFKGGNYFFGVLGCDNVFAYEVNQSGYLVFNPSRHIKTIHVHQTNERTYDESTRLPRPYLNVTVCMLNELSVKSLLLIQPGKVGDIIICAPIAKYYSQLGYEVDWLCEPKYHELINHFNYCKPISLQSKQYDKIIDLSFGLNTKAKVHALWMRRKPTLDSFVRLKYELSNVPVEFLRTLEYTRNHEKEQELFDKVVGQKTSYKLVHRSSDYGSSIDVSGDCILFKPAEGFTIFDWRLVIERASEIHCIDSSLVNFVDNLKVKADLFYYITDKVPMQADRTLLVNKWKVVNKLEYANSL